MKNLKFYLLSAGILLGMHLQAENNPSNGKTRQSTFNSGEKLTFLLHYGFFNGGTATLSLRDVYLDNKPVLHAKMLARTTGVPDKIFKIEDIYESYFDKKYTMPYKSVRNISEGNYKYYNEVEFKHNDTIVNSVKSGEHVVPKGTLDMISAFYYVRTLDLNSMKSGEEISINTFFDDALFPFRLRYKGKEVVETKLGSIMCHRFDPIVEPGRIFNSEDDMSFWLTDDKNRVPVLIRFDLIVGSVKCELISYENLKADIKWED